MNNIWTYLGLSFLALSFYESYEADFTHNWKTRLYHIQLAWDFMALGTAFIVLSLVLALTHGA